VHFEMAMQGSPECVDGRLALAGATLRQKPPIQCWGKEGSLKAE